MSQAVTSIEKNILPVEEKQDGPFLLLWHQLKSPLVFILLAAAALSVAVGEGFDAIVILFAIGINTILGFVQEYKASQALSELRRLVKPFARVRREGEVLTIAAADVVLGDTLLLEAGDVVVADACLIMLTDLQVNESTLTGESAPVTKGLEVVSDQAIPAERTDMVFTGTTIVGGRAEARVVAIGAHTELGKTAQLVRDTEDAETPLQAQIRVFSRLLVLMVLGFTLFLIFMGLRSDLSFVETMRVAAAIAVAAVPEGLLVGMTVVLVVGMRRILKAGSLVRRLIAVETLGSVSVICTDKTGTITAGTMHVVESWSMEGENKEMLLTIAALCNNAYFEGDVLRGTPTETALMRHAFDAGYARPKLEETYGRLAELPFSSAIKYMATLHTWKNGQRMLFVKGAPEIVLPQCLTSDMTEKLQELTRQGLRVLAVAYKEVSANETTLTPSQLTGLTCVGFFAIADPLRPEAVQTIAQAKAAGVRTVIITGDHPDTARRIAQEAGFDGEGIDVLTGVELDLLSEEQFAERVQHVDVFARVTPAHKVRIIQAWRAAGASVAMIGDGVNDGPALKGADVGVALGSGTEVAKQTSDIVLLDNNLATLVRAIEQGRVLFDNIRKIIVYLLANSTSELFVITIALVFGLPLPILPAQILWINLVTDGFPHVALTFEPGEPGIMKQTPRPRVEPILNRHMKFLILTIGLVTNLGLLAVYGYLLLDGAPLALVRTAVFVSLGLSSLLYVFSVRSLRASIFRVNPFQNFYLNIAVLLGTFFLVAPFLIPRLRQLFGFVELGLPEWGALVMIAVLEVLLIELAKYAFSAKRPRTT